MAPSPGAAAGDVPILLRPGLAGPEQDEGRVSGKPGLHAGPGQALPVPQCGWLCPWPSAAGASFSSGFSTTRVSVVSSMPAIDAAFCTADRVTFTGSMTPWAARSPYSPVAALKP